MPISSATAILLVLLPIGCGPDASSPDGDSPGVDVSDYDGLDDDASWVYRDDGETGEPNPSSLLIAHHVGEGRVEFRRGIRWADAEPIGFIQWNTKGGLILDSWDLGGYFGDQAVPLVMDGAKEGSEEAGAQWYCTAHLPEQVSTWYAIFPSPLEVDCLGDDGLPGAWYFASDVGLVRLNSVGFMLDLVAPW